MTSRKRKLAAFFLTNFRIQRFSVYSLLMISLIMLSRAITLLAFPRPSVQPDTTSYINSTFLDFSLVSFTGDAVRGWPTPLLYALAPNQSVAMIYLMLISSITWTFLGVTLLRFFHKSISRYFFLILYLVLACSPQLIQWETVLLAQSLMISTIVILITLVVRILLNPKSTLSLAYGILFAGLLLVQKSSNLPISIIFFIIFLILGWKIGKGFILGIVLISSLTLILYGLYVGKNVDNYWSGTTYSGKTVLWHMGGQSPASSEYVQFLDSSTTAPKCLLADAPFQNIDEAISSILRDCDEAQEYLSTNAMRDLARFLLANPDSIFKMISIGFGAITTDSASHYGKAVSIFPNSFNSLLFGLVSPDLRFSRSEDQVQFYNTLSNGEAIWIFAPSLILIAASLVLPIYLFWRRRLDKPQGVLLLIQGGLILQTCLTFILIPSEWLRLSTPFFFGLLALAIFFICQFIESLVKLNFENK